MNRLRTFIAAVLTVLTVTTVVVVPSSFAETPDPAAEQQQNDERTDGTAEPEAADASDEEAAGDAVAEVAPEVDDAGAIESVELEAERSPWTGGLMMSIAAMCIGGFSALLGIWIDRDVSRPRIFAASMSVLIFCALVVGVAQAYLDQMDRIEKDQDLERMLDMTYEIAVASGDPELIALVEQSTGVALDVPPAPEPSSTATPSTDGEDAATAQ